MVKTFKKIEKIILINNGVKPEMSKVNQHRRSFRMIIIKSIKTLKEFNLAPSDLVCLVIPSVQFIYKTADRINTRAIIIDSETYSEVVNVQLYKNIMSDKGLRHMCLIMDTELLESDVFAVSKKVYPDDIVWQM